MSWGGHSRAAVTFSVSVTVCPLPHSRRMSGCPIRSWGMSRANRAKPRPSGMACTASCLRRSKVSAPVGGQEQGNSVNRGFRDAVPQSDFHPDTAAGGDGVPAISQIGWRDRPSASKK